VLPSETLIGGLAIPKSFLDDYHGIENNQRVRRHVEIVIPSRTCAENDTLADDLHDSPLQITHTNKQLCLQPSPTAPAFSAAYQPESATTMDFSTSNSDHEAQNGSGLGSRYSSTNNSRSNLRDGNDSEQEMLDSANRSGSLAPTIHAPTTSPNMGGSSSSSSHLSGLVCNVHRTTGKEPHALVGATTTILGDKLYVFGGRRISRTRPALTSDLYELDLLRRHWSKLETKGEVPSPRYFHSICALGDNKLVCYGGMSPETPPSVNGQTSTPETQESQVSVMSDVHIYDVPTQIWMKVHTPDAPQGRYAHCAAILPSSAFFASANAPMSAIQHNPTGNAPNQGSIGLSLDGTGGAEMVVVGGQDSANHYIEQISIFNLRSLKWTSTRPMPGRSCGAYRSVVTPLTTMSAAQIGAGSDRTVEEDDDDEDDPSLSGSPMLIYTNYNFLDVKLELQVRLPDGSLADKPMQGSSSPPGLRFPSGGIIDNYFVVAGTFLTSSKQEFALWALDLRTLTWARIDVASSIFSSGSWNRGILWSRRNAFVILGNRKRNLVDDYNNRRLNFSNIALVQLEAFGMYENPRKSQPLSDFVSMSAPAAQVHPTMDDAGGRPLGHAAVELGELSLGSKELADMELLAIDGTRLPVNSRFVAKRWGPSFNMLMQEANPALAGTDTTLRPGTSHQMSRNSSVTITPTINTRYSTATTLTANTGGTTMIEPADVRVFVPSSRPRTLYLPHTVPTLQTLMHYLYTASLPPISSPLVTPQILCSLLQVARPYKVDGLLEAVVERLHESLDGRNSAAIFNAAAMGAGGGDGISFVSESTTAHPPRTASLAGIEALSLGNGVNAGRNPLRIDTGMANGSPATSRSRSESMNESIQEEDDQIPTSASTIESSLSQLDLARKTSKRDEREMWDGGYSAVIGLQKRGLRGLMEGRRIRERGRGESSTTTVDSSSGRVGLGIA